MLSGSKFCSMKKHVDRMSVAEMWMLRSMNGKIRNDRIKNEDIKDNPRVAAIYNKSRNLLR